MPRLIDIAARTGHAPVRALLSAAVGTDDSALLLPHEIRYRNDQYHVIYGLYDDGTLLGLIGLARHPADDCVEILHFALADSPDQSGNARYLLETMLARELSGIVHWSAPGVWESTASSLGFAPEGAGADSVDWTRHVG